MRTDPHYYTHYWSNATWRDHSKQFAGKYLDHTAGNLFRMRGVKVGDIVYVVTVKKGMLYLLGKLEVADICDMDEAERRLPYEPWEADDHLMANPDSMMLMNFDRPVPANITRDLLFISSGEDVPPKFTSKDHLHQQTLRGVRELTATSAYSLDSLLA